MSFEGEFANYEPLRRIFSSKKVEQFLDELEVCDVASNVTNILEKVIQKKDLKNTDNIPPDLILAMDGSVAEASVTKGFPNANYGYITIASVLIDMEKIKVIQSEKFPDPRKVNAIESASTFESVFPGCNVFQSKTEAPKEFLRRKIYEELQEISAFPNGGETLLDTYEYLLDIKLKNSGNPPRCPIEGYEDEDLIIQRGIYKHAKTGKPLYSTDALRLHELMNPSGSNGELFGQIMSAFEKIWFVNILRAFEKKGWLGTLRRVAFFIDGPLAVFSTPSWLAKSISEEIIRINAEQKKINNQDMIILGIEKTGIFCNHFQDLDTNREGVKDIFPRETAFLINDQYIKENIIFSDSIKPYGEDTYFGRKFFYKTSSGKRLIPVVATYSDYEKNSKTANVSQFSRLKDIMELLDRLVSNRYPNAITPLISAHAEAAIPFNMGQKLFEQIARQIIERDKTNG